MSAAKIASSDVRTAPATLLQRVLLFDGILCAMFGLLLVLAATPLGDLLDLPVLLLRLVGVGLLPWAGFVLYAATREPISRPLTLGVTIGNLLWTLASLLLLVAGWVEPNTLGYAFIIVQALLVLAILDLQYVGLRRMA